MVKLLTRGLRSAVRGLGYELSKVPAEPSQLQADERYLTDRQGIEKIQYGCGINLLAGWVNVDSLPVDVVASWRTNRGTEADKQPVDQFFYLPINLTARQPFADNSFVVGFSEDFIEHLTQAESINFLSETYRVLRPGGVLRLSFPGLEGVLKTHYTGPTSYQSADLAKRDCYDQWEHLHFYSREELRLVAAHLGYSNVTFVEFGKSAHPLLNGLETRANQQQVNTYVELTK